MSSTQNVALVGDSLLIEGIAVSMRRYSGLQIVHIDPCTVDLNGQLAAIKPDLVVMELDAPWTDSLVMLLCESPGIELAGIDPSGQRLVLMYSRHYTTRTMDDLMQIIQIRRPDTAEREMPLLPMT